MATSTSKGNDRFLKKFDTIFAFLILEIIALASFGIGGAFGVRILQIIGFFLSLFAFPFVQNNFTKEDLKPNLPWIIPLGVFFLLMGFSAFFFRAYGGFSLNSFVYLLLQTMGLAGFFLLGVISNFIPVLKKEYLLYALLGGLALYCVIVGFYSIIRYGPFYAARFRGLYYYYQGVLYPVSTEGKALLGFEFKEVSLNYAAIASLLLGSSGAGLFALSPKKDQKKFFILAGLAAIGVLYSALIPYWPSLLFMALVYMFGALYVLIRNITAGDEKKQGITRKIFKIAYFVFAGIVAIGVFILLFERPLHIFSSICNLIFHRVPGFFQNIFRAIEDCLYNGAGDIGKLNLVSTLFGYNPGAAVDIHLTRFYEINLLWQNGLIAFLLFIFLVFFFLKNGRDYLAAGQEDLHYRLSITMMALAFFLYISLFADDQPIAHGTELSFLSQSNYMMVLFFLLGITIMPKRAKEVAHE